MDFVETWALSILNALLIPQSQLVTVEVMPYGNGQMLTTLASSMPISRTIGKESINLLSIALQIKQKHLVAWTLMQLLHFSISIMEIFQELLMQALSSQEVLDESNSSLIIKSQC